MSRCATPISDEDSRDWMSRQSIRMGTGSQQRAKRAAASPCRQAASQSARKHPWIFLWYNTKADASRKPAPRGHPRCAQRQPRRNGAGAMAAGARRTRRARPAYTRDAGCVLPPSHMPAISSPRASSGSSKHLDHSLRYAIAAHWVLAGSPNPVTISLVPCLLSRVSLFPASSRPIFRRPCPISAHLCPRVRTSLDWPVFSNRDSCPVGERSVVLGPLRSVQVTNVGSVLEGRGMMLEHCLGFAVRIYLYTSFCMAQGRYLLLAPSTSWAPISVA